METEKKGLFGRLMDFWKESFESGMADRIGFRHDTGEEEKPFAEMGAVASLAQEETKKVFRDGGVEPLVSADKNKFFELEYEEENRKNGVPFGEEVKQKEKGSAIVFQEALQGKTIGAAFLMEMPEKEKKRNIMPVAEEKEEKTMVFEESQKEPGREHVRKEEPLSGIAVDIEKLMRDMTKKLWEERESCGRRLR